MTVEKYKLVIDSEVCGELVGKGFKLIDIVPSFRYKDRLVFVFLNSRELEAELTNYDSSTYYK